MTTSQFLLRFLRLARGAIACRLVWAVTGAFAQTPYNPDLTPGEITRGWRDRYVLAKPRAENLPTVDADEAREGWTVTHRFPHFGGLRVFELGDGDTPEAAIARLRATGRYEFADHDYVKHLFTTAAGSPNDPNYSSQWGLANTGSNVNVPGPGVAGADIHALSAWTNSRYDAPGVVVCTLDTGALLTHSDLAANLWTNPSPNGTTSNGFQYVNATHGINATVRSGTSASGSPSDDNGHGTHVAGIIGAVGNNGVDVSGVAWTVQLMPLKFLTASGSGTTTAEITCLEFALAHGANIINGSFGSSQYDSSEYAALQALDSAGVILVFAAGNAAEDNDLTPSYPASYALNNVVAVAASDNRDDVVFFSSYGSGNVDLAAPGYNILSLYNTSNTATQLLSGTSMATPFVTGSLALLKAQFPGDTPRQLINRLLRHVDPNFNFTGRVQTGGRLNLAAALASASGDNTPFNDAFASRSRLAGSSLSVRSSNVGATRESGEPIIQGNSGGASLWWEWTAPASGPVTVGTTGSSYATLVAVYTGSSPASLTPVAANASPGNGASAVTFAAQAGTTYELTVDGQGGASGLTLLNVGYTNDSFASATTLTGSSALVTSTTRNATIQSGEPKILGNAGGHSLWYTWTAPKTGQFQVSAFSYDFDPLLATYTGSGLTGLTLVSAAQGGAINASANIPASICLCTIHATAGTTYQIQVDGATDSSTSLNSGQFTLTLVDSLWQAATGDSITCAPAVGPDGTLYVGSDDGTFYAFNPDGSTRWQYATNAGFDTAAAAVGADGSVYASSIGNTFYAFTANGGLKWTYPLSTGDYVTCAPALGSVAATDDTVYFKAEDGSLYAVASGTGTLKWTYPIPGVSYAAPTVGPDGTIYVGSDNSTLYAVSPSGSLKWSFTADASIYTAPAIDGSGNLYFGSLGGTFYAVSAAGAKLWSFAANNSISSSPALGGGGVVYFGSYDHHLYALSTSSGAVQWSYLLPSEVRASSPAVDSNGVVYVGCYDNNLYAINANGSLNRTFATAGWVRSSPVIFGTTLYFGSYDHKFYAFDIEASASGSAWPMFLGGPRRLGRAATAPLAITVQPTPLSLVSAGSPLVLTVSATGQAPLAFQWYLNGMSISGAVDSTYVIPVASAANFGSYTVVVSGPQGSATSQALSVTPGSSRLANLSARAAVGTNALIAGFVVSGGGKSILVRGAGPTLALAPFGVSGALSSPTLSLYSVSSGGNSLLNSTATWSASLASVFSQVGAFGYQSAAGAVPADTALVSNLGAGSYTANITGAGGASGVALAEIYDADSAAVTPKLSNLSAKALVGTGSSVLVGGFVILGNTPKTVLLRGVGPTLAAAPFNISGVLATPQLSLYNSGGTIIQSNFGWANSPTISAAEAQVGAFSLQSGSADAAMIATLAPGAYTVEVSGLNGTTGVALVEIWDVQ